jgi:hypothetical protein
MSVADTLLKILQDGRPALHFQPFRLGDSWLYRYLVLGLSSDGMLVLKQVSPIPVLYLLLPFTNRGNWEAVTEELVVTSFVDTRDSLVKFVPVGNMSQYSQGGQGGGLAWTGTLTSLKGEITEINRPDFTPQRLFDGTDPYELGFHSSKKWIQPQLVLSVVFASKEDRDAQLPKLF